MHVNWEISVWNLVSWLLSGLVAAFAAGKASQLLTLLVNDVSKLKTEFSSHVKEDNEHFENIAQGQADLRVDLAKVSWGHALPLPPSSQP